MSPKIKESLFSVLDVFLLKVLRNVWGMLFGSVQGKIDTACCNSAAGGASKPS